MKKLWKYFGSYKKECILAPAFKMLEASFELLIPKIISTLIDQAIPTGDTGLIVRSVVLMVLLGFIGFACALSAQYFAAKAAVGFSGKVKSALFAHIQTLSFADLDKQGTSALMTRLTSDMNQIQSGVNLALRLFLRSPFIVFGSMIMAFTINVRAALIFALIIPLLSVVVFGIMLWGVPLYKRVQGGLDRVMGRTRENLTGVRVLRAFHKEEEEIQRFDSENQALTGFQLFAGRISGLLNPLTYLMINLATVWLIWSGALKVSGGILTQGQVVALVNYMSQILVELIKLANLIINVTKAAACASRVEAVMEITPSMEWKEASPAAQQTAAPRVSFDNVSLQYPGAGENSISMLSFEAMPGEMIGIIGATGAGKTSVVNLIARFYDATGGTIRIDGVDIRDLPQEELRRKVRVVPQKAELFSGTIADNLRLGRENASEAALKEALSQAQALDFVMEREGGLSAEVVSMGTNFSGGQRQRLTIARALAADPEILILDDSTSALDFATEAALRQAIHTQSSHRTIFMVSQRAASLRSADRILVLDDGRLCGVGTHEELLREVPVYQEIYYSQFPQERPQAKSAGKEKSHE